MYLFFTLISISSWILGISTLSSGLKFLSYKHIAKEFLTCLFKENDYELYTVIIAGPV